MTSAMKADHLSALKNTIASTRSLLESLDKALSYPPAANPNTISPLPNPLALLADASSILKAQTTKLSLLILNKPFTPSAITYILTSLSTSCLPALMSALELCPPATHSALLHQHIRTLLSRGFRTLSALLATIPQDDCGNKTPDDRETLAATGLLWETCDSMAKVASTGLLGLATEKLDTYHGLLKDAIAELEEWDPNEDTETDTDSDPEPDHPVAPFSKLTINPSQIPHLRTVILRVLRHIRLLYPALRKRRIRPFPPLPLPSDLTPTSPPSPSQLHSLDALLTSLSDFSSEADEVAGALYARDEEEVLRRLTSLKEQAESCVQDVLQNWEGAKDEFTTWAQKWIEITRARDFTGELAAAEIESPTHIPQQHQYQSITSSGNSSALKAELPIR